LAIGLGALSAVGCVQGKSQLPVLPTEAELEQMKVDEQRVNEEESAQKIREM
jgi:hypothetical protein